MASHVISVTPTTFEANDVVTVSGSGFDPSYTGLTCILVGVTDPAFDGYAIGAGMHVTGVTGTVAGGDITGFFSGTNYVPTGDYLLKITDNVNGESDNSMPVTVTAPAPSSIPAPVATNSHDYTYSNPGPGAVAVGSNAVGQGTEAHHFDLNPAWAPSRDTGGQGAGLGVQQPESAEPVGASDAVNPVAGQDTRDQGPPA